MFFTYFNLASSQISNKTLLLQVGTRELCHRDASQVSDIRRFFWHFGIAFSEVAKTTNCLVFLVVLLAEANLESKNTFQLLLGAEISPLESGADDKVPNLFGTDHYGTSGTPAGGEKQKMMKKIMNN